MNLIQISKIILLMSSNFLCINCDDPEKLSSCSAKLSNGIIDLISLDNPKNPRSVSGNLGTYQFNPCSGFTCGRSSSAAVCLNSGGDYGDQTTASFSLVNMNELAIMYTSKNSGLIKTSYVLCSCEKSESLSIISESSNSVSMKFSSACCCPDTCKSHTPKHSLSPGSVLLIIFFVLLAVYFLGGILFMKFVKNSSGLELLPNISFWLEVPANIKDGFSFVVKKMNSSRKSYENI